MKKLAFTLAATMVIILFGCHSADTLPNGIWRGVLKTESRVEIPFNFELADSANQKVMFILNGKERLLVDEITVTKDSLLIRLPVLDTEIRAKITSSGLSGKFIKHLASSSTEMDFSAQPGVSKRFFKVDEKARHNISGRWSTLITNTSTADTTIAVGEFEQKDDLVSGTFLTPTGDFRFLEGTVTENTLMLSTFDGSNAYLFTGSIESDSVITQGLFYSGGKTVYQWAAKRDEKAALPDAYSLTSLRKGLNTINFKFADLDGKEVSLSDTRFKNKVVIVQFLGSWCPNCMDETAFLAPFYEQYKNKGVEIIGLAYERSNDIERSRAAVARLQKRFGVNYPLLITGFTNKEVLKSMPSLNEFKAFPTTLILDKKGMVRKIHTGFSGPGTGKYYTDYIEQFEKNVLSLLNEV